MTKAAGEGNGEREHSHSNRLVKTLQWSLAGIFVIFVGGIITWIIHLIRTAWWLEDVPSASIGISLIAIPVFLVLLGVVLYVFRGLLSPEKKK
jgi:uncharacterized membrane protein